MKSASEWLSQYPGPISIRRGLLGGILPAIFFGALWCGTLLVVLTDPSYETRIFMGAFLVLLSPLLYYRLRFLRPNSVTLTLDEEGFEENYFGKAKRYRWDQVSDFVAYRGYRSLSKLYFTSSEPAPPTVIKKQEQILNDFDMWFSELCELMQEWQKRALLSKPRRETH